MKPVWHFLNSDSGGVARYVERLVAAQVDRGQFPLRVAGSPNLTLPAEVRRDGYSPWRSIWGLNQWRFAIYAGWLARSARSPVIVHAHNVLLAAPDVFTAHGLYSEYTRRAAERSDRARTPTQELQSRALSALEQRCLRLARHVVFVSSENRAFVEEALALRRPGHFHVIAPGVDTARYTPGLRADLAAHRQRLFPEVDGDRRWLLFVGHDFVGKGLVRLLRALGARPAADWALLAFGRDPAGAAPVRALAAAMPGRVHIFDDDERLPAAYGLSDCLVLDSTAEGYPLVLLEAMAAGCVPVVTRFGGAATAIADGADGFIVDSAAEVAERALTVAADRLQIMAAQAVRTASGRTWGHVAAAYADLYQELA